MKESIQVINENIKLQDYSQINILLVGHAPDISDFLVLISEINTKLTRIERNQNSFQREIISAINNLSKKINGPAPDVKLPHQPDRPENYPYDIVSTTYEELNAFDQLLGEDENMKYFVS